MEKRQLIRRQIAQRLRDISDEIDQNYFYLRSSNNELTLSFVCLSLVIISFFFFSFYDMNF
jgi:hypothetical protein